MNAQIKVGVRKDKHTPGPWAYYMAKQMDNTGGFDFAIRDDREKIIAEVYCNVGFGPMAGTYDKRPAEANARLIANAPELLERLEFTNDSLEILKQFIAPDERMKEVYKIIEDRIEKNAVVIAKARGE